MWTVVYMAGNKEMVDKLRKILEAHEIIVKIRTVSKDQTEEENCCYEVLVPQSEVNQAQDLIIDVELN